MPKHHDDESDQDERDDKPSGKSKFSDEEKVKLSIHQWWIEEAREGSEPHQVLDTLIRQIEDDQQGRYEAYREYERMFGVDTSDNNSDNVLALLAAGKLSQNELANTIETLWAQVFKNRVVPAVSTSDADYDEWLRARSYGRWLEGVLDEAETFEEAFPRAGLDALVYGTGAIKVLWEDDAEDDDVAHIRTERINPKHLFVDRVEAENGKPRQLFQKDRMDRFVMLETYGCDDKDFYGSVDERRAGIFSCTETDERNTSSAASSRDMLVIREAWHLPSRPGAKDGRHVVWIRGCTLVDEPWEWDCFPFVFIRFGSRLEGFWGESAVKRLAPMQKLLDKLNHKIDESQDIMGVPRILVQKGAQIVKSHIDDVPGGILEIDNINGIKEWNAQCVTPELYNDRDSAPHKMRSLLGVSEFESQNQIPQGMRDVSGAFLERWVDQGQARHAMFHKEYENAVVRVSYLFMRLAEDLQEKGYKVTVCAPAELKTNIDVLDFKEVRVDRRRLKLRVQPMSHLPQTFAGKVEAITKLKELMPLDPKTVARMTEVPDIQATTDMLTSGEEIILKNINFMVKEGKYLYPLPFDDFELIKTVTTRFINAYRIRPNHKMERVALLSRYIQDAILLEKGLGSPDPNAPPPPDPMGMPPGAPPGMGPEGAPPGPMPGDPSAMGVPPPPDMSGMPPPGM
jgi:hypothetical protein